MHAHVKTWTHMQNNHTHRPAHCVSKYGDRHMKARQTMKLCLCWPISKLPQPIGPLYVSLGLFSCFPFSFLNPGSGDALVLCFVAIFPFVFTFLVPGHYALLFFLSFPFPNPGSMVPWHCVAPPLDQNEQTFNVVLSKYCRAHFTTLLGPKNTIHRGKAKVQLAAIARA